MKTYKIYTAGKMAGLSFKQQMSWRDDLKTQLLLRTTESVKFAHPPIHSEDCYDGREIMSWDLNQIADCDIVVVNLNSISSSIGTLMELGFINAINSYTTKHIYVVGIGEPDTDHPWIDLSMFHWEDDVISAADYIAKNLLL